MILVTSSAIQRVELQQESYTKKATDKEVGYEFLIKEEELMYYEFCQQVVELNKSLVWRNVLRVLPTRGGAQRGCLERGCYYEFYQQEVELKDCLEKQEVYFRSYLNGEVSRSY